MEQVIKFGQSNAIESEDGDAPTNTLLQVSRCSLKMGVLLRFLAPDCLTDPFQNVWFYLLS
jgi:hypothetical protein